LGPLLGPEANPALDLALAHKNCGNRAEAEHFAALARTRAAAPASAIASVEAWLARTASLERSQSSALVVGVSRYTRWTPLAHVPQDVERVKEILTKHGFDVEVVLDPTSAQLVAALKQFFLTKGGRMKADSRLLFYYAGHGASRENRESHLGYLVPADADAPDDDLSYLQKLVCMEDFRGWARNIAAKHAMFIFDSCFSGTVFDAVGTQIRLSARAASTDEILDRDVRLFITAGDVGQEVFDRSVFNDAVIEALRGMADSDADGLVLGTEVGRYVQEHGSSSRSDPQWGVFDDGVYSGGDIAFKKLDASAADGQSNAQSRDRLVEIEHWRSIMQKEDPELLRSYLDSYEQPLFSSTAQTLLEIYPTSD
jgi:uncharacterized caspase-like protein